jgi:hypothetical protein
MSTPFEDTVYNVLAAKYLSESASDVGQRTFWFVKKYGHDAMITEPHLEEGIRKIWNAKGKPRTNLSAVKLIKASNIEFTRDFKKAIKNKPVVQKSDSPNGS